MTDQDDLTTFENVELCLPSNEQSNYSQLSHFQKRGKLRRACNSCSKIKKRCDGNRPCLLCVKSKLDCKYEERVRPGPTLKAVTSRNNTNAVIDPMTTNKNNSIVSIKTSKTKMKQNKNSKQLIISNQSLLTVTELNLLNVYIDNINNYLPILSKHIIQDSLTSLSKDSIFLFDNSLDMVAKICLAWCSCTIVSYLSNDSSFSLYLSYSYSYIRRLLDGTSIYVTRALIAYEILLSICVNQSNVDICKGSYYQLGENIYKIKNYTDYSVELLYNYYRTLTMKIPSNKLLSIQKLWYLSNGNQLSNDSDPVKYSYANLMFWYNFMTNGLDMIDNINSIEIVDFVNGYKFDVKYIQILEAHVLPSERNDISLLIFHYSVCMNRIISNQLDRVYESVIALANFILQNPFLIISTQLYVLAVNILNMLALLPNYIDMSVYQNVKELFENYKTWLNTKVSLYYGNSIPVPNIITSNGLFNNLKKLLHLSKSNHISKNGFLSTYLTSKETNYISKFTANKKFLQFITTDNISHQPTLSELALPSNFLDKCIGYEEFDQPLFNCFSNLEKNNNQITIRQVTNNSSNDTIVSQSTMSISNISSANSSCSNFEGLIHNQQSIYTINDNNNSNIQEINPIESNNYNNNIKNKQLFQCANEYNYNPRSIMYNSNVNTLASQDIDNILDQIIHVDSTEIFQNNSSTSISSNNSNNSYNNNIIENNHIGYNNSSTSTINSNVDMYNNNNNSNNIHGFYSNNNFKNNSSSNSINSSYSNQSV